MRAAKENLILDQKNKYITVERRALNATDRNDAHRKAKMESMQNNVECFLSLK